MELQYHHPQLHRPIPTPLFFPYCLVPDNYVRWIDTPDSHIFSAVLPGVRKEEIRVEVEDSTYMSIRTEAMVDGEREPARKFARKFRLPAMVDVNGITAGYEDDGVLTVRVPRALVSRGFFIDPSDLPVATEVLPLPGQLELDIIPFKVLILLYARFLSDLVLCVQKLD